MKIWTPEGEIRNYLNGVETPYAVGTPYPVVWNYWDPANPPAPPPVIATPGNLSLRGDAGSILDVRHLPLIVNTGTTCPMLVQSVSVWQASAANNLVQ